MSDVIQVQTEDGACWELPALEVARHRAAHMARLASGDGPSPGNKQYETAFESEVSFGLRSVDELHTWAAHNLDDTFIHARGRRLEH